MHLKHLSLLLHYFIQTSYPPCEVYPGQMLNSAPGVGNPGCVYRLGDKRLESTNRPGDPSPWQVKHEPAVPWQPGGTSLSWGASGTASLTRQGRDCPALLCTGVTSPPVLGAVLGATV
ncbi:hypothetical protein Nmel_006104 [Mimus melanotis]